MGKEYKVSTSSLGDAENEFSSNIEKIGKAFDSMNQHLEKMNQYWNSEVWDSEYQSYRDMKEDISSVVSELKKYPDKLSSCKKLYAGIEKETISKCQQLPADAIK